MMRTGLALWRVAVLMGASWAGMVASAQAQYYGAPLPLAEQYAARPIHTPAWPVVTPVAYANAGAGGGCAPAVPCDGGLGCEIGACPTCESCGPCDACGGCQECVPCRPCYADARCFDPWYVSLSGGWQHRETVHEASDPGTFIEFYEGFVGNAAIGYRFNMFRVEAEYTFMNNQVEFAGATGAIGSPSPATGNVNLRALMFNIYHDIDLPFTLWRPYVGAGIGMYQSDINSLYPSFFDQNVGPAPAPVFAGDPVNSTSDLEFAYQFRVGASRSLGERTEFFAGYRYFDGDELTFSSRPFAQFAPTFHPDGTQNHAMEFGLRVRF